MWRLEPKYARPTLTGPGKMAFNQSIEWLELYDWSIGCDGFSFADLTEALWASGWIWCAEWQLLSLCVSLHVERPGARSNRCHTVRWHVRKNLGRSPFWAHHRRVMHHGVTNGLQRRVQIVMRLNVFKTCLILQINFHLKWALYLVFSYVSNIF